MTMTQPGPAQSHGALRRAFIAYDRTMGGLDLLCRWAIGLALGGAFLLLVFQVLVRYVLPFPFPWIEEAAVYLCGYIAMIGAAVCLRQGFHLQVDLLQDALGPQAQFVLIFIQNIIVIFFGLFLVKYGYRFVMLGWGQTSPSSYFLVSYARMAMPVGGVLIILQALVMGGRALCGLADARRNPPHPPAGGQIVDV
ncbi:TRAP transporter small permease [Pseudotabrizicola sediminis]|uniref:TRAP transporter small permease protein n=1 Tax=Pseudotabrizicola sediminis TaxID=2486418 RepID=A0ABY2KM00_9RHOB|nr:TRAP transporter small permease [Pseudotabrizicola sediminis]TGD41743.1 TRAP transporter small permease [Pseudotabrizicola sediminis]